MCVLNCMCAHRGPYTSSLPPFLSSSLSLVVMFWLVALKAFWSLCVILVSAAARMVKVGEQYTQPPRQIVAARTTAAVKWSYVLCFPSEVCVLALPLPLKSCSTAASSQAGLWVRVRYGPFVEDLQIARNTFFAKTRHEHCICTSYTQRPSFNLTCKSIRSSAAIQVWARAQIGASIFLNLLIHTLMAVGCMSYSFVSQKYIQTQRGHTHTLSLEHSVIETSQLHKHQQLQTHKEVTGGNPVKVGNMISWSGHEAQNLPGVILVHHIWNNAEMRVHIFPCRTPEFYK